MNGPQPTTSATTNVAAKSSFGRVRTSLLMLHRSGSSVHTPANKFVKHLAGLLALPMILLTLNLTAFTQVNAQAATPTPSLPIDVVFASTTGTTTPFTGDAQYTDYMTQMATWWITQARGNLGAVPNAPDTSTPGVVKFGAFQWTDWTHAKYLAELNPCADPNNATIVSDARQLWTTSSSAYTSADNRRLLVITDDSQCSSQYGGVTFGGPTLAGNQAFNPGWGEIMASVLNYGQTSSYLNPIPGGTAWSVGVLIHEMGHSFGLRHADGEFSCSSGLDSAVYGIDGESVGCTRASTVQYKGYGDDTNFMGNSDSWQETGLNGYQKMMMGIIQEGQGLTSVTTPGIYTNLSLYPSKTTSATVPQEIRVVDSKASPVSEYAIDFPALAGDPMVPFDGCTVRVLRVAPTPTTDSANQTAWTNSTTTALKNFTVSGNIPDTMKVDDPHGGSAYSTSNDCLANGDTYTSWSGDVQITVTGVAADNSSATIEVDYLAPKVTIGTVTVAGTATVGSSLTVSASGVVPSNTTLTYQWYRGSTAISGATNTTYTVTTADVGYTLSVTVTGSASGYVQAILTSAPTGTVLPVVVINSVTISGTPTIGSTLTAVAAGVTPSNATLNYQWYTGSASSLTAVSGATGSSYIVASADGGNQLMVTVTGSASGYTPKSVSSVLTSSVLKQGAISLMPMSGTAQVGSTLSVAPSSVTPSNASLTYQWYYVGSPMQVIAGATASSYAVTATDLGKQLDGCVTATAAGYTTPTACVQSSSVIGPSVTIGSVTAWAGTMTVAYTASASVSNVSPSNATLTYQWYRGSTLIPGATGSSYVMTSADVGYQLTVMVTGSAAGYTPGVASATAGTVLGQILATVTQYGTTAVGGTMTVLVSGVSPSNATVTYQWYRWGATMDYIPGATGSSYVVTTDDVGDVLRGCVTVTAPSYATYQYCPISDTVTNTPLATIGSVTLSTLYSTETILNASVSNVSPSSATVSYQWYRAGVAISGATGPSYAIQPADVGSALSVQAAASASGYATGYIMSAPTISILNVGAMSVAMSGTAAVGSTLSVSALQVSPSNMTLTYTWNRSCPSAPAWQLLSTNPTYTLTAAETGCTVYGGINASAPGYASMGASIASAVVVSGMSIGSVILSGPVSNMAIGSTVTAVVSGVSPSNATLTYEWFTGSAVSGMMTSAPSLSSSSSTSSITATAGFAGLYIQVAVFATAPGYGTVVATSAPTGTVGYGTVSVGSVTLSGTAKVGSVLSMSPVGVTPTSATFTYEFYRYTAATQMISLTSDYQASSSYTLTSADVGYQIYGCVMAVAPSYHAAIKCSNMSAVVTT